MKFPKIILVDDEEDFCVVTAEVLRSKGFECDYFLNGNDAYQAMSKTKYQVLISDLRMPGNHQMEFIERSRAAHKDLIIIMSTGMPSLDSAVKSVEYGVKGYLLKPYPISSLIDLISKIMSESTAADLYKNFAAPEETPKFEKLDTPPADKLAIGIDKFAIIGITDAAGRIVYANDLFCIVSKYSRDELLGQNHRILNSGVHPEAFWKDMWQTVLSGRSWRKEVCNRAKDSSLYWVDCYIYGIFDADRRLTNIVSMRIDITERRLAEAKLEKVAANKMLNAQMSTVAQLAAGASHEINNPLAIILGHASLLRRMIQSNGGGGHSVEAMTRYIDKLINAANRISETMDHLRKMSEMEVEAAKGMTSPSAIIESALSLTRERAYSRGVGIAVDIESDVLIDCCGKLISHAIINLVAFFTELLDPKVAESKELSIVAESNGRILKISISGGFVALDEAQVKQLDAPFYYNRGGTVKMIPNVFIAKTACQAAGGELSYGYENSGLIGLMFKISVGA